MTTTVERVNVSPSSTEGHFIEKASEVINLDNVNETFLVKGPSELVTKNHTTLINTETCLITCQMVYQPFKKIFEKSHD